MTRNRNNFNSTNEKYDKIYRRCIEICPDMNPLIDKIRLIPPSQYKEREIIFQKVKIRSFLPDEPHEIDEFSSGEELLESFEKGKYDVAILDMYMKKLNGVQTACDIDNDIIVAFHTSDVSGEIIGVFVLALCITAKNCDEKPRK
ncbi:MAG: response regulator [Ruminococcus flavefaciens]|nr:response regulator [Ruminococcus flavefaciens]